MRLFRCQHLAPCDAQPHLNSAPLGDGRMKLYRVWTAAILAATTLAWDWSPSLASPVAAASPSIAYPDNTPPKNVDVWCGKAYRSTDGSHSHLLDLIAWC
jgi:hypothetical protein